MSLGSLDCVVHLPPWVNGHRVNRINGSLTASPRTCYFFIRCDGRRGEGTNTSLQLVSCRVDSLDGSQGTVHFLTVSPRRGPLRPRGGGEGASGSSARARVGRQPPSPAAGPSADARPVWHEPSSCAPRGLTGGQWPPCLQAACWPSARAPEDVPPRPLPSLLGWGSLLRVARPLPLPSGGSRLPLPAELLLSHAHV